MIHFKIIIIAGLLILSHQLQGQNFKNDIDKINASYQFTPSYKLEMDYNLYASHSTAHIYESTSALIKRNQEGYYAKMFDQETIINQDYIMLLDHESKLFMIDRFSKGQRVTTQQTLISNDSLIRQLQSITGEEESAINEILHSEGQYTILYNYGELEKMVMSFDPSNYRFRKIAMYYRLSLPILENQPPQKPRLEIVYKNFEENPEIPQNIFDEKTYAIINLGKSLVTTGKMKNYTVINHLWNEHLQH